MTSTNDLPDFYSRAFLIDHVEHTMRFYHPRCIDPMGGFYHYFCDDGSIYDSKTRHLVSSTRFIFNYTQASIFLAHSEQQKNEYLDAARHGIAYLRNHHYNPDTGGYGWILSGDQTVDGTNHCYGLAFVMLAYASAVKSGISEARPFLDECFELMETHFWDPVAGLYRDEISANWEVVSSYRGQNANMHSCEAMIAAYQATHNDHYLSRALTLAEHICLRQAELTDNMIWEHYHEDWSVDWDYNRDDPKNLFRPWGFQPGHMTEWAKLLVILYQYKPSPWLLQRSKALFDTALERAWDKQYGGICYGSAPSGEICDGDKYFWVQAESLAAAAMLAKHFDKSVYIDWYERIWRYSWQYMVDHQYGAWYRILSRNNEKYDTLKSPAGKTDYHTMGACYDVLRTLER